MVLPMVFAQGAKEAKQVELVYTMTAVPTDAHAGAMMVFKETVERLSGGEIKVLTYDSASLFKQEQEVAAADNLGLNGAAEAVTLRHGDFRGMAGLAADLVLANLTGALLIGQAEALAGAVAPGGSLIASGLTLDEEEAVTAALGAQLMTPVSRLVEDEWVGLRFDRR